MGMRRKRKGEDWKGGGGEGEGERGMRGKETRKEDKAHSNNCPIP